MVQKDTAVKFEEDNRGSDDTGCFRIRYTCRLLCLYYRRRKSRLKYVNSLKYQEHISRRNSHKGLRRPAAVRGFHRDYDIAWPNECYA